MIHTVIKFVKVDIQWTVGGCGNSGGSCFKYGVYSSQKGLERINMIFKYTLANVRSGKKTQTRRLVNATDDMQRNEDGSINTVIRSGRTHWQVGKLYAVQPDYGKKAVAKIEITGLRRENIQSISDTDAVAEGLANREAYLELWQSMHGPHRFDAEVWVIEFKVAETYVDS